MWRPLYDDYHDDRQWDVETSIELHCATTYDPVEWDVAPTAQVAEPPTVEATIAPVAQAPAASFPVAAESTRGVVNPPPPPTFASATLIRNSQPGHVIADLWQAVLNGDGVKVTTGAPAVIGVTPVQDILDQATAVVVIPKEPVRIEGPIPIGNHAFEDISGTAGTGKTTLTQELARRMKKGSMILAATTGIAAVNLGGGEIETTTINSALKYYDTKDLREKYIKGKLVSMLQRHRRAGVRRIVIDEKSMMAADQLTDITRAVIEANDPTHAQLLAMSGEDERTLKEMPEIGVTLVGDFGQLAPVPEDDTSKPPTARGYKKLPVQYAFESPMWEHYTAHRTVLEKVWRQDNLEFVKALHAIRKGEVSQALQFFTPDKFARTSDDQFEGTTIFGTNKEVDHYNLIRLDKITGREVASPRKDWGTQRPDWGGIPQRFIAKVGAAVMILNNERMPPYRDALGRWRDGEIIHVNGDTGVIVDVEPPASYGGLKVWTPEEIELLSTWRVQLHRTGGVVEVHRLRRKNWEPMVAGRLKELKEQYPNTWKDYVDEDHKKEMVGWVDYLPLRVAYAATVHKSQGLTLERVQVNIGDYMFKKAGMLFVAFSRCRTPQGLRIVGDQHGFAGRCTVEGRVVPWL